MANGGGVSLATAGTSGPRAAPVAQHNPQGEAVPSKRDLASWWRNFKKSDKKALEVQQSSPGIFGVPLHTSIRYANVAISLFNDEGQSYIYGYVPIVVAKCGVYLKEKATDVEGIFRLAGSERRIKDLKIAFDSPDRYGKGLDWTGYTVHDAANILRRYFNQLPEPIIPLDFYERFRDPLKNHQAEAVGPIDAQSPSQGGFDQEEAIRAYQELITELPPLNRQLLLYILDLLAVFASKSDLNKMTTPNLAAIFQPGLLSHPQHDMAPQEYRLSQDVLIFLIENQDSFLIGMPGTAADKQTVQDVQSGTPVKAPSTPTTPGRSRTIIGRSGSNATSGSGSVGADSVRKFGSLRRNVSASSKHSKSSQRESRPTPVVGSPATPSTSSVHRSNTVPSRRAGGGTHSPRFAREKSATPPTPSASGYTLEGDTFEEERSRSIQNTPVASQGPVFSQPPQPPQVQSASSSEATTPMAAAGSETSSAVVQDYNTPKKDTTPLLAPPGAYPDTRERSASNTPSTGQAKGGWLDVFKQSPTSGDEGQRRPNKLQKKRAPGSSLSSAHSSSHSLPANDGAVEQPPRSPVTSGSTSGEAYEHARDDFPVNTPGAQSQYATAQSTPMQQITPQRMPTDATLRPAVSPTQSYASHTDITDISDADMGGDETPVQQSEQPSKEKRKHRWRFSRSQNKLDQPPQSPPQNPYGHKYDQTTSRSTIGSSIGDSTQPRRSFQAPTPLNPSATDPSLGAPMYPQNLQSSSTDPLFSDSEREKRGPVSWIRGKLQERKEKDAEKRARTPDRNRDRNESKGDLMPPQSLPVRGPSFDQSRHPSQASQASVSQAASSRHGSAAPGIGNAQYPESAPTSALPTASHGGHLIQTASAGTATVPQHQQSESAPASALVGASNGQLPPVGNLPDAHPSASSESATPSGLPTELASGDVQQSAVPRALGTVGQEADIVSNGAPSTQGSPATDTHVQDAQSARQSL
ncbi:RhoGAP-domain-containing protein [Polychaeton citri CBS 116435]|uniref:RhoGAP-domain-containing protein n=1 Tax=Polychaeton citri CBS 116435 TaxID=1314669 RepID=A0A9P4QBT4_9PEZI|nr:RhoGAP-domain-containing protein [Polychaeton citri CBS 116435]